MSPEAIKAPAASISAEVGMGMPAQDSSAATNRTDAPWRGIRA